MARCPEWSLSAQPEPRRHEPGQPAASSGGARERPWLLPPPPGDGAPEPEEEPDEHPSGRGGGTAFRVLLLIGLLGAVTAAGIVVGRAVEPGSAPPASTPAATTTAPPPTTATTPPAPPRPAAVRWGPLRAVPFGELPAGGSRAAAAIAGQNLVVVGGTGSARILAGPPGGRLVVVGALPRPRAAMQVFAAGGALWGLGGEQGAEVTDELLRIDVVSGRTRGAGTFEEPLAEAGVAVEDGSAYLVGGWTGDQYASAVLRFTPPSTVTLVSRLPAGVRSPAVLLLDGTLYVAGGRTELGPSTSVYAVDLASGGVRSLAPLPQPVEGGVLVARGGKLYLLGGRTTGGKASRAVIAIDPAVGAAALAGRTTLPLVGAAAVVAAGRPLVVDPASGTIYRVS